MEIKKFARIRFTRSMLAPLATAVFVGCGLGGPTSTESPPAEATALPLPPAVAAAVPGPVREERQAHSATLLTDGRVLVAGGYDRSLYTMATSELFDPSTGLWSPTGSLAQARAEHAVTLLSDGRVLVAGGRDSGYAPIASAEVYDPATGEWSPVWQHGLKTVRPRSRRAGGRWDHDNGRSSRGFNDWLTGRRC